MERHEEGGRGQEWEKVGEGARDVRIGITRVHNISFLQIPFLCFSHFSVLVLFPLHSFQSLVFTKFLLLILFFFFFIRVLMTPSLLQFSIIIFDPCVGKILWRRKWQSTPVFLPGAFYGQRSLVGYRPCGRKRVDRT